MIKQEKSSSPVLLPPGHWVRRRYRVESGCIFMVRDSAFEVFDLMEAQRAGVARRLAGPAKELMRLDVTSPEAVEAFASQWGLLGLFLDPRWSARAHEWVQEGVYAFGPVCGHPFFAGAYEDHQSLRRLLGDAEFEKFHVLILPDDEPQVGGGAEETFWGFEPLGLFQEAVEEFQEVARLAAEWQQRRRGAPPDALLGPLYTYVGDAVPDLQLTKEPSGKYAVSQVLTFPSLLSSCYGYLLRCLCGGALLKVCGNHPCSRVFDARRPDQLYCSDECQNAQRQRRHRERCRYACSS